MWSDNETIEDLLGFKVHSDLIRTVVTNKSLLPLTLGVFGDWGGGKTSIMKMLQFDLDSDNYAASSSERKKYESVVCIYFNSWLFEGYDDAKSAILSSILQQLIEHRRFGSKLKKKATDLLKTVDWMRITKGAINIAAPAVLASMTGGASILFTALASQLAKSKEEGNIGENIIDLIKKDNSSSEGQLGIREFRSKFSEMLKESNIETLVVLIDDLDRCSPERIIDNLEAIKLFLNVDSTAFVIGADPRIVRHAVASRYIHKKKADNYADYSEELINDYLEKLIQIPYHLPKLSPAEIETYMSLLFCSNALDKAEFNKLIAVYRAHISNNRYGVFGLANIKEALSKNWKEDELANSLLFCNSSAFLITEGLKGNPRQVKRFLNAFILRKELAKVAHLTNIQDNVLVKLMVLEYTAPDNFRILYNWQASNEGHPVQLKKLEELSAGNSKDDQFKEFEGNWNNKLMQNWLNMEPKLSNIDLRDYYWIARDKLRSSLSEISLVPPIVQRYFKDLLDDNPAKNKFTAQEVLKLNENERNQLLSLLVKNALRNQDQKSSYDAIRRLIDVKFPNSISSFITLLNQAQSENVPAAVGIDIITLMKTHPVFASEAKEIVDELAKKETPFGKALKIKK